MRLWSADMWYRYDGNTDVAMRLLHEMGYRQIGDYPQMVGDDSVHIGGQIMPMFWRLDTDAMQRAFHLKYYVERRKNFPRFKDVAEYGAWCARLIPNAVWHCRDGWKPHQNYPLRLIDRDVLASLPPELVIP